MEVLRADLEHLEEASRLFDQYRVFYQAASDLEAAREFIQERCQNKDSVIFVSRNNQEIVGFTQLYPSFSSISMKKIWILNDLFVAEQHRKKGVAKSLMHAAKDFARETGAVRLVLSTQMSNVVGQSLYESLGYVRDKDFYHYSLSL